MGFAKCPPINSWRAFNTDLESHSYVHDTLVIRHREICLYRCEDATAFRINAPNERILRRRIPRILVAAQQSLTAASKCVCSYTKHTFSSHMAGIFTWIVSGCLQAALLVCSFPLDLRVTEFSRSFLWFPLRNVSASQHCVQVCK